MKSKASIWFTALLVGIFLLSAVAPVTAAPQDTVRVWVTYRSGHKADVGQGLERAGANVHFDFPELEAYVVTLPAAALNGILRNPFVVDVEEDPARYPIEPIEAELEAVAPDIYDATGTQVVPWGIDAVQARDVWDPNKDASTADALATGAGIKVCIIDTGYYVGHEDLKTNVLGTSQVDNEWFTDGAGHGSHVAGTISALNNALGVVGVTPGDVDLFIVKIFANDGAWVTGASNLVSGIYSCRDAGADVISMSLGGTKSNRTEQKAFDALYAAGILHIAAAGNEQETTPGATSYPAGYGSVVSVAAVDSSLYVADFSLQNADVELAAPGVSVLSTVPFKDPSAVVVDGVSYTAMKMEFSKTGSASGALVDGGLCTSAGSWSGKVVLCQRGDISFYDKTLNVKNSGGVAAVIYNNVPGIFSGTLGTAVDIVSVSLSQADGQYLVANKLGQSATVTGSDLVASINSYEAWDGTSMATPHVAGVAALVWSANPTWTNVEIRNALTATAQDLGVTGRDNMYGYGLVKAADALTYLGGGTEPPVEDQLVVSITAPTPGQNFSSGQVVTISGLVTAEGQAVSGATVKVTIKSPRNKTTTLPTVTTNPSGSYSLNYTTNRKNGTGTYTITVTATKTGYLTGSATTTFVLK